MYTFEIVQLNTNEDNSVISVNWRYSYTEFGFTSTTNGIETLEVNVDSPDYIQYEDLDEATVTTWVKNAIGVESEASIKEDLRTRVLRHKKLANPTAAMPWD